MHCDKLKMHQFIETEHMSKTKENYGLLKCKATLEKGTEVLVLHAFAIVLSPEPHMV